MSRAIHRGSRWYQAVSILLVLTFALSVTAVATVASGGQADSDGVALASRGNGNGHDGGRDRGRDRRERGDRGDCECDRDCDECRGEQHCEDCPEYVAPTVPAAPPAPAAPSTPPPAASGGAPSVEPAGEAPSDEAPVTGAASQEPQAQDEDPQKPVAATAALPAAVAATSASSVPASGQGITPRLVTHSNPGCPRGTTSFKIDATPSNGTYDIPGGGTITISNATNYSFDYTTSGIRVMEAIVKASDDAHIYDYTSAGGVTWDTGMWTVAKPGGGYYQISHATFCFQRVETYEINGMKWEDTNGDGLWYNGVERLLPGWTIQLFKKVDGRYELFRETQTGSGGYYEFTGLPAGEYKVDEVQQSGYVKTYGGREFTLGAAASGFLSTACHNEEPKCFDFGNMPCEEELFKKTFTLRTPSLDVLPDEIDYFVTFLLDGAPSELTLSDSAPHIGELRNLPTGTEIANVQWWAEVDGERLLLGNGATSEMIEDTDLDNEFFYCSKITGSKYGDDDGDGLWDTGEAGLPGWTIRLFMKSDGQWVKVRETQTGSDGSYEFSGLLPGDYYVVEVQQAGWRQTAGSRGAGDFFTIGPSGAITLRCIAPGPKPPSRFDFGNHMCDRGKVWGYKFHDVDNDGRWDSAEPKLEGWTIQLYRAMLGGGWEMVGETTTDEDGYYEFTALEPGTYYVVEVIPDDDPLAWIQTHGSEGPVDAFEIDYAEEHRSDFGNWQEVEAEIEGYKFDDVDWDGIWDLADGEVGMPGWTIELYRYTADGKELTSSTVTGEGGLYRFTGLGVGYYHVTEVQQAGWAMSHGNWDFEVLPDGSVAMRGGPPTLAAARTAPSASELTRLPYGFFDFGNHNLRVSLWGYKFFDVDGDGTWDDDPREVGLGGWTIELYEKTDTGWAFYGSTTTDDTGFYRFKDLMPGEYYAVEVIPDDQDVEWYQTFGPTGPEDSIKLSCSCVRRDFGNTHDYTKTWELTLLSDHESPPDVSYFVTYELNGEPGRADLALAPGSTDPLVYAVDMPVAFGDQIANVEWWANWRGDDIKLGEGFLEDGELGDVETVEGDLTNPYRFEPIVFGHKFSDDDADGIWDQGEDGLSGWEIVLVRIMADGSQEVYDRMFTGEGGYYEFKAVLPGEYYVYEVTKDGWRQTAGPDSTFMVENFDNVGPLDFGNAELGRIFGYKYADLVPEGALGDEDFGLGNWTILLYSKVDGGWVEIDRATTEADGYFEFEDLLPGDYYLVEIQQDGWTQSLGPVGPGDMVSLTPGGEIGPVNFLNIPPSDPTSPRIFGHKYHDKDADGRKDADEGGLGGWRIELYYKSGGSWDLLTTTITNNAGYWEFRTMPDGRSALPNGEYYVVEVIPEDSRWRQTYGPRGPQDSFVVNEVVELDYGPFDFGNTGGLPYMPFTGSNGALLALAALVTLSLGILLKRLGGVAQG